MNRGNIALFHQVFDETMAKEKFVKRSRIYWHINYDRAWYVAVWLCSEGPGQAFDIHFNIGGLMHLDRDTFMSMADHSAYSLRRQFNDLAEPYFRLWVAPDDYPVALDLYSKRASGLFSSIESLFDVYLLDKKLKDWDSIPLFVGEKWIDMLIYLNMTKEAQNVVYLMRQWLGSLIQERYADEKRIQGKLAEFNKYSEKIKKTISRTIISYQKSLSEFTNQDIQFGRLQRQIDTMEQIITSDELSHRQRELEEIVNINRENLKRSFSVAEIETMGSK